MSEPQVELYAYATAIATALGDGWSASFYFDEDKEEPPERVWRMRIGGPEPESSLFLSSTWAGRGRLDISGNMPRKYERHNTAGHITVKYGRPADQVAKEIMRRLWSEYVEGLHKAIKEREDDQRRGKDAGELAVKLAAIVGDSNQGKRHKHHQNEARRIYGPEGLTIEVSGYGSPQFNVSCTPEIAVKLAKVYMKEIRS